MRKNYLPLASKLQNVVADDSVEDWEEINDIKKNYEKESIGLGGLYSAQVDLIKMERQFYKNFKIMESKLALIDDEVNLQNNSLIIPLM